MGKLIGMKPYTPPKGTEASIIYDIYGGGILVYFPTGDKESPLKLEKAIRQSQLSGGRATRRR